MPQSAILYHNPEETVFLLDIPTSISLAQELSLHQRSSLPGIHEAAEPRRKHIFSSTPLAQPFPSSTEPKTDAARAKVLQRIPQSEWVFHAIIEPLVREALDVIKRGFPEGRGSWCFARTVLDDGLSGETRLGKRRRAKSSDQVLNLMDDCLDDATQEVDDDLQPPLILSSSDVNAFASMTELRWVVVKNSSSGAADLSVRCLREKDKEEDEKDISNATGIDPPREKQYQMFTVPPLSVFVLCRLPITQPSHCPVPGIPQDQKFNLILLDPPWNNRSVRRGGHYHTQHYSEADQLTQYIRSVLQAHLYAPLSGNSKAENPPAMAAIWITNSARARRTAYDALRGAGLSVCEEWAWIKVTTAGEPVAPVDGLWRKPYEILIIGERTARNQRQRREPVRRVIAAVPDVHSRKPNLKEIFERLFFSGCAGRSYAALEVFARNLTAGWWACGDEVLKFNAQEWWTKESTS